MVSVILFLRLSFLSIIISMLMLSLAWAGTKKSTASFSPSTHLKKHNKNLSKSKRFIKGSSLKFLSTRLASSIDMGVLSLNLMRLGKMRTYNISVLLFLNSAETKKEVLLQMPFFKELVSNMLYSFSVKELKSKTVIEKKYLEDFNIFINKGSVNALKIKMIEV